MHDVLSQQGKMQFNPSPLHGLLPVGLERKRIRGIRRGVIDENRLFWTLKNYKRGEIFVSLLLKNVGLETGYLFDQSFVTATEIKICDVLIENGKFVEIAPTIEANNAVILDAKNQLLVPSFKEMHTHIDKTYFGGEWKAPTPATKGIFSRLEEEATLLPKQLAVAEERAHAIIQHYIKNGHTHIRTHVNVDPQIETKHMEIAKRVLDSYQDQITYAGYYAFGQMNSNIILVLISFSLIALGGSIFLNLKYQNEPFISILTIAITVLLVASAILLLGDRIQGIGFTVLTNFDAGRGGEEASYLSFVAMGSLLLACIINIVGSFFPSFKKREAVIQ